jgi:hypothetical protein
MPSPLQVSIGARVDERRALRLADAFIGHYDLDLSGLTVLTEAASGPYLFTPLLAARANAECVHAWTRDSRWAPGDAVSAATQECAVRWGVGDRIEVSLDRNPDAVAASDIITNSGFVRRIDETMIGVMKPTAVIPLMWETWEFRESDLDLAACRRKGILVLGTRESEPPCDMRGYGRALALKLVFDLGLELQGSRILLLGAQTMPGRLTRDALRSAGAEVDWFGEEAGADWRSYDELRGHALRHADAYDAVIVTELESSTLLLGDRSARLPLDQLADSNPSIRIGVIAGKVDAEALAASGLIHVPDHIAPMGYMSYQPALLGPRPVLDLYAAGLKVGQEMARARLAGLSPDDAAQVAEQRSPAMSFPTVDE